MRLRPSPFLLVLLLLAAPVPAHEARVNPEQRSAIQEQMRKRGCLDPLAKVATRGGTRGVTRGGTRSISRGGEPNLPPEIEQYDHYFSQVIPVELDLPYGKKTDPKAHIFFRHNHEGPAKMAVMEELGVGWRGAREDTAPTVSATWMEMAKNYHAALAKRGVDPKSTFVPAFVLYKDLGETTSTTGKKTMRREFLFIDPMTEPFPEDMAAWKILTKDVAFNISFQPIFEAMQKGKFPLLDAAHDVSHFVSFLRFPEFAQTVRKQMAALPVGETTSAFKGREYWLTEAMSVLDPAGQTRNHDFLTKSGRPTAAKSIADREVDLKAMNETQLTDYAYKLAKHFEGELRDVSGGNSNAAEKWYYLSESFGMRAEDMLKEDISTSQPIGKVMEMGKIYFENAPINLSANPKTLTNETATFSFNTMIAAQKLLALSLKEGRLGDVPKAEAVKRLAQFAARAEYLMAEPPPSYQEWATKFLAADLPATDPLAKTLTEIYGNEIVPRYYLGRGQPRPKKPSAP